MLAYLPPRSLRAWRGRGVPARGLRRCLGYAQLKETIADPSAEDHKAALSGSASRTRRTSTPPPSTWPVSTPVFRAAPNRARHPRPPPLASRRSRPQVIRTSAGSSGAQSLLSGTWGSATRRHTSREPKVAEYADLNVAVTGKPEVARLTWRGRVHPVGERVFSQSEECSSVCG
jgi:hypothetical protein